MSHESPSPLLACSYDHLGIILWGPATLQKVIEQQCQRLERYPEYKIGWDFETYTYDYLAEHDPALLSRMRQALTTYAGRLDAASCTYGQPLSMFIDGESNIRQLSYGLQAAEKHLGISPLYYIMSEHPFHSQLPQLLVGAGFRGAVLRTHFMMYGFCPEFDEPAGWWVGLDGSRIRAIPTYKGQASTQPRSICKISGPTSTLDNRILTDSISEDFPLTLRDFARAFGARIQPLVATRADDPRSHESLITAHHLDPAVQWATLPEAFAQLPESRAEFHTRPNDFPVRMPWGYAGNRIWALSRQAEAAVQTAERLNAVGFALGKASREAGLEIAWKNLLVGQHHDIQIVGSEEEARRFLGQSIQQSQAIIQAVMDQLSPRIGSGRRLVAFNPLGWERTELIHDQVVVLPALGFVSLPVAQSKGLSEPDPFTFQAGAGHPGLRFRDNNHPNTWQREGADLLTTPHYEVVWGAMGGIRLLVDRLSGQHLLTPPRTSGTLAALVDGLDCVSLLKNRQVKIESQSATVLEEGEIGGLPFRMEWKFYMHTRRIDWHMEIQLGGRTIGRLRDPNEATVPDHPTSPTAVMPAWNEHEYKLRLRFYPYQGPFTNGIRDLPFHVAETGDHYVNGLYWTAASDGQVGLALFNRGLMGSVRESDGAFSSILAFDLPYVWKTSHLEGIYTYDLGILPFLGEWRSADLHCQALEYNFPVVVQEQASEDQSLGISWTPFTCAVQGQALLSTVYASSGQLFARFYEIAGNSARVSLRWCGQPVFLTETNLRETSQAAAAQELSFQAWQVKTARIQPSG